MERKPMKRRTFLQAAATVPVALANTDPQKDLPKYRVVTPYQPWPNPGMPGRYAGQVVRLHAEKCIDPESEKVDVPTVQQMISQGMRSLTGHGDARDSWAHFFQPGDVVGIKVNCSGAPGICSTPEVVAEIVRNLGTVGVKPENVWIYERFQNQMNTVHYDRYVPSGVHIWAAETWRGSILSYDPKVYAEVDFIGTLANVEPIRSRTVLSIMDGLRGVWHGGPFSPSRKFRFYPKQMMIGTDPVAMDRLLLDVIDDKRKAEHAMSVWTRSKDHIRPGRGYDDDPNFDRFIREPGHIEYASTLGLGVYDIQKIKVRKIEI